jgi:hypothetical protein
MLGGALLGQKKYAEAEPLLLAGYTGMKEREKMIPAQYQFRLVAAAKLLVQLYEALDRKNDVAVWAKILNEHNWEECTLLATIHDIDQPLRLTGLLDAEAKALIYQIRFKAGVSYVIDMIGPNSKKLDPYLQVRDPQGKILAEDDDSGGNLNARIVLRTRVDDIYRIRATSFGAGGSGDFTLTARAQ